MKAIPILISLHVLICFVGADEEKSPVIVKLATLGKVEGYVDKTVNDRQFFAFDGVPYAQPPINTNRFKEPIPVGKWSGVWVAKTVYRCMQYNHYTEAGGDFVVGDEDCLYLNIYTPTLDENANLDVIVYIHGGAFMFGCGAYQGPHLLLDRDVVYVNLNYRLGPLGFLSTEDDVIPGNNGIKDQILALQWIQDNIKQFGGNPQSVTLTGSSAGGASVHIHYLTPTSRGLFQRGISQSGTALNPWVLMEEPLMKTRKIATVLGCENTQSSLKMVECLREKPARQIVYAVKEFQPWLYNPFSPFGPVVDTWASKPVLPQHPFTLIKEGHVADLPWIVSFTESEGLYPAQDFYADEAHLEALNERWDELMPHILDYNHTIEPEFLKTVSQKIRYFYLNDQVITRANFMEFVKIVSDRLFVADLVKAARLQASVVKSPVYMYYFTYRGAHSRSEDRSGSTENMGAAHADDASYVMMTSINTLTTEADRQMIGVFVEMFTSFARNGTPNVPQEWPAMAKDVKAPIKFLKIAAPDQLVVEEAKSLGNQQFWDRLPLKENEKWVVLKQVEADLKRVRDEL